MKKNNPSAGRNTELYWIRSRNLSPGENSDRSMGGDVSYVSCLEIHSPNFEKKNSSSYSVS